MHPFRKLLLIALGRDSSFEKDLDPKAWQMVFRMAREQALVGILNVGVHRLPAHQMPPEDLLKEWDEQTAKIGRVYHTHENHVTELDALLTRLGLHGCILKGTGLAHLYPVPERRMCGDIDLWIKGTHDSILEAFDKTEIPIYDIIYQECKAGIFLDTEVEIHFHASKMYNPFRNARLQRYFNAHTPIRQDADITYPDLRFNAVFCMAHMFRHYLEGGIGLRQMMDYYYVLRALDPSDRAPVMRDLRDLGMADFTAATMLSLQFNFGLEDEYLLCSPDRKRGPKLIDDMIRMGNFGVMDSRNYSPDKESSLARFNRKNRRVFSHLKFYPGEVIWSPFARLSQWGWRKVKGYL